MSAADKIIEGLKKNRGDYYALLGVDKKASEDDIARAYKRMALRLHPDKCKHKDAEEMFKLLGDVKGVLLDTNQRHIYDSEGLEGLKGGGHGNPEGVPFAVTVKIILDYVFKGTMYASRRRGLDDHQEPGAARGAAWVLLIPVALVFVAFAMFHAMSPVVMSACLHHPNPETGLTVERSYADHGGKGGPVRYFVSEDTASRLDNPRTIAGIESALHASLTNERKRVCEEAREIGKLGAARSKGFDASSHRKRMCAV